MIKQLIVKASKPHVPSAQWAIPVAIGYAVVLVAMSLLQLFSLEEYVPIMQDYLLPGGAKLTELLASLIIVMQVFSLPFLLRMRLSPLMRLMGAIFSVMVPLVWLALALYAQINGYVLSNSGMFGEKLAIPSGGLQVVLSVGLLAIAVLAVYGLSFKKAKK